MRSLENKGFRQQTLLSAISIHWTQPQALQVAAPVPTVETSGQPPWHEEAFLIGSLAHFIWVSLESQNSVTRKFRQVILHARKLGNLPFSSQNKKSLSLPNLYFFHQPFFWFVLFRNERGFSLAEDRECWLCCAALLLVGSGINPTKRFLQL